MATIEELRELIEKQTREYYERTYPNTPENCLEQNCTVTVKPGRKYTKIDVGSSGKLMIDGEKIFGIKGYGVIHRGHQYGTLDTIAEYYWGEYYPKKV